MGVPKRLADTIADTKINLTEEDILEKLCDRLRWPKQYPWGQPSVEAINENSTKNQNFFELDNYINSPKCIKYYEEGYTLILSNIGYITKDTAKIQTMLNNCFQKHINCNFYFGKGKKDVSFKTHKHDYAVMIKNIYGESTWLIDGKELNLTNQNTLFFNRDTNHEVIAIKDKKLSMTLNLN